jgi:hypothetical protein
VHKSHQIKNVKCALTKNVHKKVWIEYFGSSNYCNSKIIVEIKSNQFKFHVLVFGRQNIGLRRRVWK